MLSDQIKNQISQIIKNKPYPDAIVYNIGTSIKDGRLVLFDGQIW